MRIDLDPANASSENGFKEENRAVRRTAFSR